MPTVIETETATGLKKIHKNQAVIVLSGVDGLTYRGIILAPNKSQSLVRYNEDDHIRERKIANSRIVPVAFGPAKAQRIAARAAACA